MTLALVGGPLLSARLAVDRRSRLLPAPPRASSRCSSSRTECDLDDRLASRTRAADSDASAAARRPDHWHRRRARGRRAGFRDGAAGRCSPRRRRASTMHYPWSSATASPGVEAALALRGATRARGSASLSAEHDHFFSRPRSCAHVFAGQGRACAGLEPYDRAFYERMRFERRSGPGDASTRPARARLRGRRAARLRQAAAGGGLEGANPLPGRSARGAGLHCFVTLRDLEGLDRDAHEGAGVPWWSGRAHRRRGRRDPPRRAGCR